MLLAHSQFPTAARQRELRAVGVRRVLRGFFFGTFTGSAVFGSV